MKNIYSYYNISAVNVYVFSVQEGIAARDIVFYEAPVLFHLKGSQQSKCLILYHFEEVSLLQGFIRPVKK